jgi:hypothetical protein
MSKQNIHGSRFAQSSQQPSPPPKPSMPTVPSSQPENGVIIFDPRSLATPVYERLCKLRNETTDQARLQKQRSMAQEIYTYLSTWGLMRLKAEETILKDGREDPVKKFFECLQEISGLTDLSLEHLKNLSADEYMGLTGLALEIAREFSFWVSAIYVDVQGDDS